MDKILQRFTGKERQVNLTAETQVLCYECQGYVSQTDTECKYCKADLTLQGKQTYEAFNDGFDLDYK